MVKKWFPLSATLLALAITGCPIGQLEGLTGSPVPSSSKATPTASPAPNNSQSPSPAPTASGSGNQQTSALTVANVHILSVSSVPASSYQVTGFIADQTLVTCSQNQGDCYPATSNGPGSPLLGPHDTLLFNPANDGNPDDFVSATATGSGMVTAVYTDLTPASVSLDVNGTQPSTWSATVFGSFSATFSADAQGVLTVGIPGAPSGTVFENDTFRAGRLIASFAQQATQSTRPDPLTGNFGFPFSFNHGVTATVTVKVTDQNGQPVNGLATGNFSVTAGLGSISGSNPGQPTPPPPQATALSDGVYQLVAPLEVPGAEPASTSLSVTVHDAPITEVVQ